jgi:hypothetical protein
VETFGEFAPGPPASVLNAILILLANGGLCYLSESHLRHTNMNVE